MKKTYQKPAINTVRINTELPIAASAMGIYNDGTTIIGSDALGNMEGELDVWVNSNANF